MEWQVITALVVGIPVILFPAAYVWYLAIGGIYGIVSERKHAAEVVGKGSTAS